MGWERIQSHLRWALCHSSPPSFPTSSSPPPSLHGWSWQVWMQESEQADMWTEWKHQGSCRCTCSEGSVVYCPHITRRPCSLQESGHFQTVGWADALEETQPIDSIAIVHWLYTYSPLTWELSCIDPLALLRWPNGYYPLTQWLLFIDPLVTGRGQSTYQTSSAPRYISLVSDLA